MTVGERPRYGYFFFSSRRRHTRSYGDWSSDVCSSDLTVALLHRGPHGLHRVEECDGSAKMLELTPALGAGDEVRLESRPLRSEERREGKSVDLGGRRISKKKKATQR